MGELEIMVKPVPKGSVFYKTISLRQVPRKP
ncbi:hypothetical protein cce_3431 [Crocosphaera subtropica ATCC 51142]|uniref:Uncharacterized protein n=1 Tax=Crocosphaera subtropica (strain ATCC 51142 / BH68) TaxID=43989 RepID=B1WZ15_CROS5|nr:hypothetical protein cce_3431 [Crocosphaera subtropica ATCC 51142]